MRLNVELELAKLSETCTELDIVWATIRGGEKILMLWGSNV